MDIRELALHDMILDPRLNLRDRIDRDTVERYAEAWNRLPPVTVYKIKTKFYLADGIHRHAAAVLLGRRSMKAEIVEGTFEDALDYVAGANLFHGLPLSRAERRRAIEVKLKLHHERSDRRLAEELAVGRELVAKIRRQLIESGQVPAGETRLGADGKVYPAVALPRDPGERLPKGRQVIEEEEEVRPKGRRGKKEWDDTIDALPPITEGPLQGGIPWQTIDSKSVALSAPVPSAAPTIDEMLAMMAREVMKMVNWTMAEGFLDSYRAASPNARGLFQTAVIKLAARADQLRKI
jgi:ParB-like chromosome segregation protein Spo0J